MILATKRNWATRLKLKLADKNLFAMPPKITRIHASLTKASPHDNEPNPSGSIDQIALTSTNLVWERHKPNYDYKPNYDHKPWGTTHKTSLIDVIWQQCGFCSTTNFTFNTNLKIMILLLKFMNLDDDQDYISETRKFMFEF